MHVGGKFPWPRGREIDVNRSVVQPCRLREGRWRSGSRPAAATVPHLHGRLAPRRPWHRRSTRAERAPSPAHVPPRADSQGLSRAGGGSAERARNAFQARGGRRSRAPRGPPRRVSDWIPSRLSPERAPKPARQSRRPPRPPEWSRQRQVELCRRSAGADPESITRSRTVP